MKKVVQLTAFVVFVTAAVALSAGQAPPPPSPQPQQPTFRLRVDYVEVDVVVTDQQGNLVKDLKKEDFQVLEDGKAQTVSAVHAGRHPDRARGPVARGSSTARARRADQRNAVRRPRVRHGHR